MTKAQAMDQLAVIVRRVAEQSGQVEYTLGNFITGVVFPWYRRTWKLSTSLTTEGRVRLYIIKELGDKHLSSFNRTTLQDFLEAKAAKGLSYSTVAHLRWDLRQIFRMAVNDGLLPRNPAELLHVPKGRRSERRVLTIEQTSALIAALTLRDRLIIKLAGIVGMRPGEILGLQWGDQQQDGLHITRRVYRAHIDSPKTHHSIRTAAITNSIQQDLRAWKEFNNHTNTEDWIFPSENQETPLSATNFWRRNIAPKLRQLGLQWVNFQVLRRSAVSNLYALGTDPKVSSAQMGHTLDVNLSVYTQSGVARQQEAVDLLDSALTKIEHARLTQMN